jgi:GNAT superfamily N-acetyltransferase
VGYEVDDDPGRVDLDVVWRFLSEHAYWGRWRTRRDVEAQVAAAWRMAGCYDRQSGAMVGFARATSDGVGLAYLADVFVLHGHRRQGLGRSLVAAVVEQGPGADFRWLLHTADAHALYAPFGFRPADDTLLERPHASAAPQQDGARAGRLTLVVVVDVPPAALAAFEQYEAAVLPLLPRHGGRLERRLRSREETSEVHVVSFASRDGYASYLADPDRQAHTGLLQGMGVVQRVLDVDDVPAS